ncbi:dihydropteroate synthase [Myxococcota bacterium]|nr:dihydropteroate synthase [Myxococcota bacterium]MBU1379466.1 dihydropteroate synthase [Myxococcota bacterium]MBU1496169.1 dihydropteroate synthase [Myxococcota bacterium]
MDTVAIHGHTLNFLKPVIMGVINVTPDSFFDGGAYFDASRAIDAGFEMMNLGAHILDIGGESTRPGSTSVDTEEELRRVIPVIHALSDAGFPVSIDTMKSTVARIALEAGAFMVNDVSGGNFDPEIISVADDFGAGFVVGHMRGLPENMQSTINFKDVITEVAEELALTVQKCKVAGIPTSRIFVDPGIGFGKTALQSALLTGSGRIISERCGCHVLIGPSNKSFIGKISGAEVTDRLPGTISSCIMGWISGAKIFRVHDVTAVKQAFDIAEEIYPAYKLCLE